MILTFANPSHRLGDAHVKINPPAAPIAAATLSSAARCTICCRTAFTSVRWCAKARPLAVHTELWGAVQAKIKVNASGTSRRLKSQQSSLLVGLVFDGDGRGMTLSHATKPCKRYRYCIARPDHLADARAWCVSAYIIICDQL